MALKQDTRPDKHEDYDDNKPGWRDDSSDLMDELQNAPQLDDDELPEGHPDRRDSGEGQSDLEKDERGGKAGDKGKVPAAEKALAENKSDQVGEGWKPNKDKSSGRSRIKVTRKQGIAIGITGLIIGSLIGGATFFSGPLQFLMMSKMLQGFHFFSDEQFMNGRAGRLIRYARTANTPERRNMGYAGNRMADHYERRLKKRGMTIDYDGTRRIRAVIIDTNTPEGRRAAADMKRAGANVPDPGGNSRIRVDLDGSASSRRLAINGLVESAGLNKVSTAVSKRMLKTRALVDFSPRNITRGIDEDIRLYARRVKQARSDYVRNGVDTTRRTAIAGEDGADTDADRAVRDVAAEAGDITDGLDSNSSSADIKAKSSSVKGKIGRGAGVAGVLALTCGLYKLGDQLPAIQYQNLNLPLMRTGMDVVVIEAKMAAGLNVSNDDLGVRADAFHDEITNTNWSQARSIQAEQGKPQTGPDLPDSSKPGADATPKFFDIIINLVENIIPGGERACGAVNSRVGGWIISAAGWVVSATGPVGAITTALTEIGIAAASNMFIDDLIRWLINAQVDSLPEGALFGNQANYGLLLAANDAAISHGGTALSTAEVTALDAERERLQLNEFQQKSFYARYFDLHEPRSLASSTLLDNSAVTNPGNSFASLVSKLAPDSLVASAGDLVTPKVAAQQPYDYGFPEYGFSLSQSEDERLDDPYANAAMIEPRLRQLNDKYGDCFATTIDPVSYGLTTGQAVRYDQINDNENCKDPGQIFDDGSSELTRYRFYLADMVTSRSLLCYEGLDELACQELGFGDSPAAAPAPGAPPVVGGDFRGQDTSTQTCTIGTDGGIGDTPDPTIKIRLCSVGGILVNVAIASHVNAVLTGGQTAGLRFGASTAYRTYDYQVSLRRQNCGPTDYDVYQKPPNQCTPETAIPGRSMHEWGLAVDFTCSGATLTRTDPCFGWLGTNQATHMLINLPSEAWHWSSTGS